MIEQEGIPARLDKLVKGDMNVLVYLFLGKGFKPKPDKILQTKTPDCFLTSRSRITIFLGSGDVISTVSSDECQKCPHALKVGSSFVPKTSCKIYHASQTK